MAVGDDATTCRICGSTRPSLGPCPDCGDLPAPAWPGQDVRGPAGSEEAIGNPAPTGAPPPAWGSPSSPPPGPPPPPTGPPLGAPGSPSFEPPPTSSGSGCRRVALILAVIVVVGIGIVVVASVVLVRRVQDQGITFDIDESGGLSVGDDAEYGDDPDLDALWDACADEDWDACDQLYFESLFLSEYERFGDSCGDRREAGGELCVEVFGDGVSTTGPDLADGDTYGDDPELDEVWDQCDEGDLGACDELYFSSPIDSGYEQFAVTCGDRNEEETPGSCDDGATTPSAGLDTYGDDPELDALWDDCEAGEMVACDQLFLTSPLDTDYEEFGQTCGRTREPDGGLCDVEG